MSYLKKPGHVALAVFMLVLATATGSSQSQSPADVRAKSLQQMRDGNFKDAYSGYRKLCLDRRNEGPEVAGDLRAAVQCLARLGRVNETDELLESTVAAHVNNWRLLREAAVQYTRLPHHGFMIAGEFRRGDHRGGGKVVNSLERDRVRALQLMQQALPLAQKDDQKHEVSVFYLALADILLNNRGNQEAWRLQYLSDLDELPDYDDGYPYFRSFNGAPVDEEGNPVYHHMPQGWEAAETDGQRWRWALDQAVENNPRQMDSVHMRFAQFLQSQFGVETMLQGPAAFRVPLEEGKEDESGTFALHTLAENETIARLATGIKRFELPDEFNHIKIYQQIADRAQSANAETALNSLAQVFENRRQYPKAAGYWKTSLAKYAARRAEWKRQRLQQIEGNWGRFEPVMTQPAGKGATVEFRFRNGKEVSFQAHEIKVSDLLRDVKNYLKSDPGRLDWKKLNIGNIGWRIVQQSESKYLGRRAASWKLKLQPRQQHFDRRITISTPLQKSGAYLLTANMKEGNTSKIVIWVSDTAIVNKRLSGKSYYFIADAETGKPTAGANVEFFGYQQKHLGGNRYQVLTTNFSEISDRDGQVIPDPRDLVADHQWVVIARGAGNRLAFLGFQSVWYSRHYDRQYNAVKAFCITDRPVYRPDQTMQFKLWIRRAQYDQQDVSQFAGVSMPVEIINPKGEKVSSQTFTTDKYGGLDGSYEIPADAPLGQYRIRSTYGGGSFRVEEYKKPEFEVLVDAPDKPVMLGEKITAKIKANYYFGAPVTEATVKYKVLRSQHSQRWYPVAPWDWCYGRGYWWFGYDYPWYPGWLDWVGCLRPVAWWWPMRHDPPEVVAEREVPIGADGTVDVDIDTQLAKAIHGDQDHQYTISAEVRDQSRRTIVGQGRVLVARKPFKVFAWVHRGYYRVGETVQATFQAQTLDERPVQGTGVVTLLKIHYDQQRMPVETPVQQWELDTDAEGRASLQLDASAKGQYRLSYQLTDEQNHTIEGGYLFTVIGEGFDGKEYRFNNIELIPDQREYRPGDTVKLQINSDRAGATVLLFVRPANGIYLPPKILRLKGKSTVADIDVAKKDMPNFFVEAVTISDGKVHAESKEIVVPPEKRVLNVDVLPSNDSYKPGQKAKVKVHLTDATGENFVGSTVVAIYDKSVEYISGGSNVPDIKEFFWKWRRTHQPNRQSNLGRYFQNLTPPKQPSMANLGVFGGTVADELGERADFGFAAAAANGRWGAYRQQMRRGGGFGGGGIAPGAVAEGAVAEADAAAPPAAAMLMDASASMRASKGAEQATEEIVQPVVRSQFADTALWVASLTTDKTGLAELDVDMPENLTTWKVKVWGVGHGTKVGSGEAEVVTRKDLILRLQAPRFFVQNDEVVLSANVHNYLDSDKEVTVSLELPGQQLQPLETTTRKVTVESNGEQRVDWRVKVLEEGTATVRMKALTDEESDAMQVELPCFVHGMLKTESWAGTVRPDQNRATLTIEVPAQRRPEQSLLEIRYSPTLAGAMVDALPYLADYPYGCTEQTLNRFLPTVITQRVLLDMDLNLELIRDKRTNLNAQEIGDDRQRAQQWKRFKRNPVFDQDELNRMVKEGVKRLTSMQLGDGGWGWFSGWQERSYPHTTAVVVHGLQVARQNEVPLVPDVLERGLKWLERYQGQQVQMLENADTKTKPWKSSADNLDAFVYMVLVDAGIDNAAMRDFLYRDRTKLAVYSKAMFALALHKQDQQEKLAMLRQNIQQYLVEDPENETAYLKLPAGDYWWYWYGSEIEANAYYLKLLSRVDAKGKTAPRLVKYLLNNRKHATYWSSTRDTAVCIEAFADFIQASGEAKPDMVVQVLVDGQLRKEVEIDAGNLFTFDNKFLLAGEELTTGSHQIEIRRRGSGPVYFNAYLTNFTLEDHITKAGLEVKVQRKYYQLVPVDKRIKVEGSRGQAVDQRVEKYRRVPLDNLATLNSGELVEIELEIESKNDYEYLLFEDMKAAGFEPVEVRSGYTSNGLGAYMELRDNRVVFFVRRLARGKHSIAYRMRAEIPGKFSALPTRAYAMYAPELKGNSDEIKLNIRDR